MTKRSERNRNLLLIGQIIKKHREELSLTPSSRQFFIEDREQKNLLNYGWISEKTLTNIENGHNLPSLITLKKLAVALEVSFTTLIEEIEEHIPVEENTET